MPKDILPNLRLADVAEFSTASTVRTESHSFNAPPGQSDHVSACEGGVPLIGENASLGNGGSLASNCVNYYQMTSPDVEIPRDGSAGSAAVPAYVQVTEGTPASSGTDFGVTPNGVLNSSSSNRIENEGPFQGQGESAQTENSHPQNAFQSLVSPLQYEHRPPFVEETFLDGQGSVGQPSWSNNNQHLGQNDNGPAHVSGGLSSPVKTNSQQQMSFDSNSAQQQGTFQESNSHHSLQQVVENSQEQFGVSSVLNQFGLGPPKENLKQMVEMSQSVSVDAHQFGGNLTSANPQQNNAFQLSSIVNPLSQNTVQQGNFGQTPTNSSITFPSQNALFHQASSNFVQLDIMETTVQHLNMSPQDQMAYNSEYPQLNPATEQHMSRLQAEEKSNENHQTNIIEQKKEPSSQLPVTLEQQFPQNENQQAHQVDLVADHHSPHISDNIETSPQQFDVFPHLQTKTDQQVQSNYTQQSEENFNPHYVATTDQTGDHLNNQQQNNTYTQQQINVDVNTILNNQHNNLNPQIGFNASKQLNNETMDQSNVFWEQQSNINTFQQMGTVNQPEFNNPPTTDTSPVPQTNHQQQSNAQHSHDQLHLNLLQQLLSNSEHDVSSAKPGDSNASHQVITGASSPGEGMNGQQMFPNLNVQVDQSVVNGKSAPESPVGVAEQCVSATQLSPVGNFQTIGNVQSAFSTLPTSSGNLFSINETQPGDSFATPSQPFSAAQQLSFDNFKGSDSSAQQTYNDQQTVTSTGQLSVSGQQPITVSTAIVHPSGFPTDLPAGFPFAQNPEEKIRLSPSSESLAAGLLQMLSNPGNDFSSASDLATQVKQARYAPNEKDQSLNRPATSEDLSFQSLQPSEQDLLYETIDSLVAQNDGKTEHIQNKDTVRNFQQIGDNLRNSEPTPINSFGQVDSAKDSLSFEGLGKRSFDASTDESNQVNFNTPVKNFPTLFQFTEPQMQSPSMGQTTAFGLQIPSTVQSMNADGVDSHHVSRSTSGQTSPSNIDSSHCTGDESNGQSSPSHSTSRNRCHLKRLAEDLPRRLRLHIQSNLESENSSSSHSSVTSPTQSNHIPMEHDNASQASLVALSEQLNIEHARKAVPSSITTGNNRPDFDEETMFNITSRPNDTLLPSVTTDADSGSTPTMSFASIRKATPVSESFVPRCSDMLDTGISSVSITDDSNDGVFRRPALEPARYKKMPGRAKKMREASLTQQFPASANGYQLQIIEQPEDQHRARYKTEGSRGSVKDRSQQGHPAVKLVGMNEPVTLQVFVGNDTGKVKPHGFYQACKVCGKTSTPCFEKDIEGTTVIELQMDPSTDMIARIDCVGILKLRNADVEQRMGLAKAKKKSLKARLVFRVTFKRPDGCFQTLQVSSHPILCTQPIGCPEISKKSLSESSVEGGEELFIIGKNFMKGTKVLFQQLGENGKTIWEAEGEIDKDYFQNTHLICTVPAYHDLLITSSVTAQVVVRCSGKPSYPLPFTYMPKVKQERMEVDPGLQQLVNGKAAPDALKLNEMIVPSAEGMFKLRPDVAMSILAENKGMKMETDQNQKACAATVVSLPGSQIATSPFIQQAPILLSNSQSAVGISLPSPQPLSSAGDVSSTIGRTVVVLPAWTVSSQPLTLMLAGVGGAQPGFSLSNIQCPAALAPLSVPTAAVSVCPSSVNTAVETLLQMSTQSSQQL